VSTPAVTARLGDLFNFVWTTSAALWNLRWQVKGYVDATGHADHYQLNDRFVKGSGITSADLITTCLKTTWPGQQEQFAKFVLFELCAMYEGWLDDVVPRAVPNNRVQEVIKSLQFPTLPGNHYSLRRAIQIVNSRRSAVIKTEFFPILKGNPKNSWSNIEDLLVAYRYFKEVRNSLIHSGGIADVRVVQARNDLAALPFLNLGLKEALQLPALIVGDKVNVGLRNVVGLSSIVHRLVVTLDAALAVSKSSERDFLKRFAERNKNPNVLSKTDPAKRLRHLKRMLGKAEVPRPSTLPGTEALLVSEGLII
jgi:hypothetical protein